MNMVRISKSALSGRLGTALAVLLLASSVNVYGQHDKNKDKEKESARPSHQSSHESAPAPHQAAPARQAPQAAPPAATPHTNSQPYNPPPRHEQPSGGQVTRQGPGQGSSGQSSGQPQSQTVHPTPATPAPGQSQPSQPTYGGQGNRDQNRPGGRQFGGGGQPSQPATPQATAPNSGQANHGNQGQNGATQPGGGSQPGGGRQFGRSSQPGQQTSQTVAPNGGQGNRGNQGQSTGGQPGSGRQFGGGNNNNPGPGNGSYNGSRYSPNGRPGAASTQVVHTRNGGDVYRSSNGSIREVHTPGGAVIHHAPDGIRRVEVSRPGGRVIVASAHGGGGYVQRPLIVNNRTYVQRTYIYHGASYARVYRPYSYGGFTFHVYTPYRYYRPAFYAYVYDPWARPVYYGWGWGARPWYGYYGGWFTPYPVYASPSLWLTDYLIARTLEDAYQARVDAAASLQANDYSATPLTPDVKQAVADEVRRQLDQERNEQQNPNGQGGDPAMFGRNGPQVFVVSTALSLSSNGGECVVTEGDVLQMNGAPPQNASYADVIVLASKGRDCRKGSVVSVSLNDLVEMQNQMRATIDQGLGDLQSKQGQNGLPTLPPQAAAPPENVFGNQVQPDADASRELNQAAQEADRAEQDVVNQSQDTGQGATTTISLGMTTSEVEQALGRPTNIADVGAKKIYVYRDMKITFVNGKVSDVQ